MRRHAFAVLAAFLPLFAPSLAGATLQFVAPTTMAPVGQIADLDGGLPDLVTPSGAAVSWRSNLGAMQFAPPQSVTLAPSGSLVSFVVTDLDGNGRADLAGLTTTGVLAVCLGTGGGAFGSILAAPLPATGNGIVAADFDGDGRMDLAVSHIDAAQISVWIGHGDGTFAAPVVYSTGTPPSTVYGTNGYRDVVAGRFGGDAKPDLAVLDHYPRSTLAVLVNQGDGTFAPASHTPAFGPFQNNLVGGDFDADGLDDLVIGVESPAVGILHALGGGGFARIDSLKGVGSDVAPSPAVGDVDGDGKLDLVFSYSTMLVYWDGNYLAVRTGTGDCHFAPEVDYQIGQRAGAAVIGDLDGDGLLDAIANTGNTTLFGSLGASYSFVAWLFRNLGGGQLSGYETQFPGMACKPTDRCPFESWSLGEVRGANAPADLFLVPANGHTLWRRNRGNGTFAPAVDVLGLPCAPGPDLTGDGRVELTSGSGTDSTAIVVTTGDATWAPPVWYVGGRSLGFADFDGDGRLDLATKTIDNRLNLRFGDGAGGFGPLVPTDLVFPPVSRAGLTFGDSDGDGRAEVFYSPEWPGPDTLFVLALPPGGGVDTTAAIVMPGRPVLPQYYSDHAEPRLARAGPGLPPNLYVLAGSAFCDCGGWVLSYRRQPDGSWIEVSRFGTGRDPEGINVADFDKDGIDDAIVTVGNDCCNQNTSAIVYPGSANGALGPAVATFPGMYPRIAFAARIDADDRPDLCVALGYYGRFGFRLNTSPTGIPTPTLCALSSVRAEPGVVHVDGYAAGGTVATARLERRTHATWWTTVATLTADGTGRFHHDDADVAPGRSYGYRLAWDDAGVQTSEETWVDVPAVLEFAVGRIEPNPIAGAGRVSFRLGAPAAVRLTVVDLQGRRRADRAIASVTPGDHAFEIPGLGSLEAGVYLLRVEAGGRAVSRRFALVR